MQRVTLVRESNPTTDGIKVTGPADVHAFMRGTLDDAAQEEVWLLGMATNGSIAGCHMIHRGAISSSIFSVPDILRWVLLSGSASFIVVHNHPSGNLEPSAEDRHVTAQLTEASDMIGVPMRDHIIIGGGGTGFTSLAERGYV